MPRLIVEAGKQIGNEFEVGARTTLGRLPTCDARIDDDDVSRQHASIRFIRGRYYVFDLQSSNGTFLNGKKVKEAPLASGDRIQLGDTTLLFTDREHDSRPTDTLGDEELRRESAKVQAVDAEEAPEGEGEDALDSTDRAPRPALSSKPAAPPAATAPSANRPPVPPPWPDLPKEQREAVELVLFALLLVLTFLCASFATQIVLRAVAG